MFELYNYCENGHFACRATALRNRLKITVLYVVYAGEMSFDSYDTRQVLKFPQEINGRTPPIKFPAFLCKSNQSLRSRSDLSIAAMGFDLERFESPVDEELVCAICKGVFQVSHGLLSHQS